MNFYMTLFCASVMAGILLASGTAAEDADCPWLLGVLTEEVCDADCTRVHGATSGSCVIYDGNQGPSPRPCCKCSSKLTPEPTECTGLTGGLLYGLDCFCQGTESDPIPPNAASDCDNHCKTVHCALSGACDFPNHLCKCTY